MPDLKTIATELREFAKVARGFPPGIRIEANILLEYAATLDAFVDQDRIDNAITRQLARSMKMNAQLQLRITALRAVLMSIAAGTFDPGVVSFTEICADAIRQDDEKARRREEDDK